MLLPVNFEKDLAGALKHINDAAEQLGQADLVLDFELKIKFQHKVLIYPSELEPQEKS